ncbi:hypothetical protein ASE12_05815 [Aeromicrobium sp. Root236]|uniref:hypothetical protein n=1 Tax=Aeromicrobium sp. Root236 TaxID=1736498 RepID=UPI0006F2E89A|nr:hypothetical protein [Aeromicrobium sp. Root236]KRC64327.1 hypothetical protein ASE12_05815 [Aeromicrobium sp. Root236]
MTEQLIEQIRNHANSEPVPDLDLDGVIRRGRQVRRRRSVARRTFATLAVGALAGSAVIVAANRGSESNLTVSASFSAHEVKLVSAAYRTGGAFSRGDTLWFSDPDYAVDLGTTIQLMYYTSSGVVAGVTNDDAGDVKRDYVYVGTDGSVRELNLPGNVVPGTDAQADRYAYLTKQGSGFQIHVIEASTGDELATRSFDAPYSWAGWSVPPIGLTGDFVVLGVDGRQQVINWRTGERAADVPGTQLPVTGGGRALGGENGGVTYRLGDSHALRSTRDLATVAESGLGPWAMNELSPDGRFVETTNTFVGYDDRGHFIGVQSVDGKTISHPVVHVTDVATGHRVTLPGNSRTYGWTPDGQLMRVDGTKVTTCDGATGDCTSRTVPEGPGKIHMAGKYLGS